MLVLSNACWPIVVSVLGSFKDVTPVQLRNASRSTMVTPSGMTSSPAMPVQPENADWPIEVSVLGNFTEVMPVLF